jgi:P-type Ca2+ transporter type 2C
LNRRDDAATQFPPGVYPWHALPGAEVVAILGAEPEHGLSLVEATRRLARVGPNRVGDVREAPLWRLLIGQFRSVVVLLLVAAAATAALLGERAESIAIFAALLLNAAIGFGTEWRARISLARLRALAVPQALVRRGGHTVRLPAAELVPGDLIVLEAGAQVPADARLLKSATLRVNEATLTGESEPIEKDAALPIDAATVLAERRTMVYLGTAVLSGAGAAVVIATGLATELGRIGQLVAMGGKRVTPLERQVERLGRRLMLLALGVCGMVGLIGILHGQPIGLMLETAISLAVAAIPEGLPAVTSVALAAGLWRLARAGALVRRLPAVETLGSTTVICSDKTGTMTENRMAVTHLTCGDREIVVGGAAAALDGSFVESGSAIDPRRDPEILRFLTVAALVNDASVERHGDELRLHGDPTEAALLVAALKAGLDPAALSRQWPRHREVPFSPETRLMATFNTTPDGAPVLLVKGAPGAILDRCALSESERERLRARNDALARQGRRVLAVAWRPDGWGADEKIEGLTILGFVALEDPLRPGVKESLARCREAGIRTVMLTGDQRLTAEAIGRELGLSSDAIRSRVSPEAKLELILTLQAAGEVVAMTGDGVNDAPALARADIGIAMGRHGTDVAREAAALVLTDDNFTTIVGAVKEGRVIYANLRKVVHFLFSCNFSEILTIFAAIAAGLPAPLLPLQILWVNLVTDILPAMALVREPAEPDVMRKPPRDPREAFMTWTFGARMLVEGALLAAGVLSAYLWVFFQEGAGQRANTVAFVALVLIHPLQAMNCRSERLGWWLLPPNVLVWASLVVLVVAQWCAISWSPLARLLGTSPLPGTDWIVVTAAVSWPVLILEAVKGRGRRRAVPGERSGSGQPGPAG